MYTSDSTFTFFTDTATFHGVFLGETATLHVFMANLSPIVAKLKRIKPNVTVLRRFGYKSSTESRGWSCALKKRG